MGSRACSPLWSSEGGAQPGTIEHASQGRALTLGRRRKAPAATPHMWICTETRTREKLATWPLLPPGLLRHGEMRAVVGAGSCMRERAGGGGGGTQAWLSKMTNPSPKAWGPDPPLGAWFRVCPVPRAVSIEVGTHACEVLSGRSGPFCLPVAQRLVLRFGCVCSDFRHTR